MTSLRYVELDYTKKERTNETDKEKKNVEKNESSSDIFNFLQFLHAQLSESIELKLRLCDFLFSSIKCVSKKNITNEKWRAQRFEYENKE